MGRIPLQPCVQKGSWFGQFLMYPPQPKAHHCRDHIRDIYQCWSVPSESWTIPSVSMSTQSESLPWPNKGHPAFTSLPTLFNRATRRDGLFRPCIPYYYNFLKMRQYHSLVTSRHRKHRGSQLAGHVNIRCSLFLLQLLSPNAPAIFHRLYCSIS
jgi:hypothetical protein